ncbi:outer membrane lipoprotein-sorting protein [Marinobacteraceae bacterium S3BR75-40.1]
MYRKALFSFLLLCALASASWADQGKADAQTILQTVNSYRGFYQDPFVFKVLTVSQQPGREDQKHLMEVAFRSSDEVRVDFLKPARDKGRKILIEGNNMWMAMPRTRNLIRVSPLQRVTGEASNGDIANTNYDDYEAVLEGTDSCDDTPCLKLNLTAHKKGATYQRIVLWVAEETFKPIKSEHYAKSGKLLKVAHYKAFKKFGEHEFLHRLLLVDPLFEDRYTWMVYEDYHRQALPKALFHKENLDTP